MAGYLDVSAAVTILWDAALLDPLSEQLQRVSQNGAQKGALFEGASGYPIWGGEMAKMAVLSSKWSNY